MVWRRTTQWKHRIIAKLRARDGDNCWLCDRPMMEGHATIEHLRARSEGGKDNPSNLVLCHPACNRHLANRPVERKKQMQVRWHKATRKQRGLTA